MSDDELRGLLGGLQAGLTAVQTGLTALQAEVSTLRSETNARLDRMDARFDRQDAYLAEFRSAMIERFERLESRVDLLTEGQHAVDIRMAALWKAVTFVQTHLDRRPAA
ncbi:MAG TPA: hypothetical protein VGF59_27185 [Bryobacteraceae bacterium]|jgi:predicted nuclease with TOPRIM domain